MVLKIALTVDWDFFADSDVYDFGHRENDFFIQTMWTLRIQGNPGLMDSFRLDGHRKTFWHSIENIGIKPPLLMVSESHLYAYPLFTSFPPDLLINFDSHHDLYTIKEDYVSCENWALELLKKKKKMRYLWVTPPWIRNEEFPGVPNFVEKRIDSFCWRDFENFRNLPTVRGFDFSQGPIPIIGHVCRSGSWMPPWLDSDFDSFIAESGATKMLIEEDAPAKRPFQVPSKEDIETKEAKIAKLYQKQERVPDA